MHHKAIKAEIKKQLKTQYPNWQCLTKKEKKAIAKKVLDEAVKNYDFKQQKTRGQVFQRLGVIKTRGQVFILDRQRLGVRSSFLRCAD
jgi:hypothetical protein